VTGLDLKDRTVWVVWLLGRGLYILEKEKHS